VQAAANIDQTAPLLDLLNAYQPTDLGQIQLRQRIIDFVLATPDCLWRSSPCGHITASAWIVSPDRRQTLLTHHRKLNRWLQLGGHADGEPDVVKVAMMEALEESGIPAFTLLSQGIADLDIHEIPARASDPAHLHYDVRFFLQASTTQVLISDESHDLAWLPIDGFGNKDGGMASAGDMPINDPSLLRLHHQWQKWAAKPATGAA
jgi:8-oxo-dGTP pyrophosphatase MutT (NUDIX family)